MTVIDAQNNLLDFFGKNETFHLGRDFINIIPITLNKELDEQIVIYALSEFEKIGFIKHFKIKTSEYWVLIKPLDMEARKIDISYPTLRNVVGTVNNYAAELGSKDIVDIYSVSDGTIVQLLTIINHLLSLIRENKANES